MLMSLQSIRTALGFRVMFIIIIIIIIRTWAGWSLSATGFRLFWFTSPRWFRNPLWFCGLESPVSILDNSSIAVFASTWPALNIWIKAALASGSRNFDWDFMMCDYLMYKLSWIFSNRTFVSKNNMIQLHEPEMSSNNLLKPPKTKMTGAMVSGKMVLGLVLYSKPFQSPPLWPVGFLALPPHPPALFALKPAVLPQQSVPGGYWYLV